jgi:arginase
MFRRERIPVVGARVEPRVDLSLDPAVEAAQAVPLCNTVVRIDRLRGLGYGVRAMTMPLTVLGVPSSAGAYAPGQELAPAALRDVGLLDLLGEAGAAVGDAGDVEGFRWRPDRDAPFAQNASVVARVVGDVAGRVADLVDGTRRALVLGGDCTVGVGTVAGLARGARVGLVYVDLHADLNTPASVPDGALDWMGTAHLLGVDGTVPALREVNGTAPVLHPAQIVYLGLGERQTTPFEREEIARRGLHVVPLAELRGDPVAAAAAALGRLDGACERIAVHLDVDVVDFTDAPLSENTGRNVGAALDEVLAAVAALARDPRVAAVTVTELNPLHGEQPGDVTLRRFAEGLARALSAAG